MKRCFRCGGKAVQAHHVIPQGRLRRHHRSLSAAFRRGEGPKPWGKTKVLQDERNLVPIWLACHGEIEGPHETRVELTDLPAGFWVFVSEYGLVAELPRHLMEASAA